MTLPVAGKLPRCEFWLLGNYQQTHTHTCMGMHNIMYMYACTHNTHAHITMIIFSVYMYISHFHNPGLLHMNSDPSQLHVVSSISHICVQNDLTGAHIYCL